MLKAMLDDHPLGTGIASFVLEYLIDAHERRVFCSAEVALEIEIYLSHISL